jgi:hypothetical protein
MKKEWTKEEFQEACRDHMDGMGDPYLKQKQARRRQWLRKKFSKKGKRHAKS